MMSNDLVSVKPIMNGGEKNDVHNLVSAKPITMVDGGEKNDGSDLVSSSW